MKALISPLETVNHVVDWIPNPNWDGVNPKTKYLPISETIPNAERVAEVVGNQFPVAEPLFWVDCANDVVADNYYYDSVSATIKLIDNLPYPE